MNRVQIRPLEIGYFVLGRLVIGPVSVFDPICIASISLVLPRSRPLPSTL
jgi:hypothetical protein